MIFEISSWISERKETNQTAHIIKLPYYLSHFINKKKHFSTLAFYLGPLTWKRPSAPIDTKFIYPYS